jgi:hypothetical protein
LGHPCIKPSLFAYYLPPKGAAAQQLLIEGLKTDLEGVKGVQSRDKLAWKGALLSAAVRKSSADSAESQGRALARVLNTNRGRFIFSVGSSFTQKTGRPIRRSHKRPRDTVVAPRNTCESNSEASRKQTHWTKLERVACNVLSSRKLGKFC